MKFLKTISIILALLALLISFSPTVAAWQNADPYITAETSACNIFWTDGEASGTYYKCQVGGTTPGYKSLSQVRPKDKLWAGFVNVPDRFGWSEIWQGCKYLWNDCAPFQWARGILKGNDGLHINFVVKQSSFNCQAIFECLEHTGVEFWSDFGGQSACRSGLCGTGGAIEIMLIFGCEGWGCSSSTWIWRDEGANKWWLYTAYVPGSGNLNDNVWYAFDIALNNYFQDVSSGVGRLPAELKINSVNGFVEDNKAFGSSIFIDTLRLYS